ncbi:hypothetical protein SCATT_00210 [Streptantibioticus cattleyicolor NRRL 8057 = DSM 46488]|uniref:MFS transporter n=1 Tax=Streptantibioticus cattleyicolor (strain ATCC 35852 / DSM 46488 / JCM 4925 / NBRC 14057 / NRRL 8057) TaxID=1003195 RepID=G8WVU7_STREN|nr:hypothetical protein SCATT_00210 [Streptantibioticus cattleyicolor NRRL 8057 = DSM 46488]
MRRCLATAFLARLAEEGMAVAVVLLALRRTGSAADGAFVLTAWMAPHALAAPVAGALAARVRRPRLFRVGALGGFAVAIGALGLLVGRAPTGVTVAVAVAGGACGPVVSGGLSSVVASLAPPGPRRARACAWDAAVYDAASVTGPALVGVVAGVVSPAAAVLLLAGAATGAAAGAVTVPRPAGGEAADGTAARPGVWAGLVAVWRVRELRAVTVGTSLACLATGGLTTVAALLAAERGHPGAGGVPVTAFAVGGLAGSLVMARLPSAWPARRVALLGLLGTGVCLGGVALVPSFTGDVLLFAAAGAWDGPLLGATLRIRADHAPPGTRTQVFTVGAGLKISAAACGAALTGAASALAVPLLTGAMGGVLLIAASGYAALMPRGRGAGPVAAVDGVS